MRHLYLLSLFFSFFTVSAQLNISPSQTGSSFIYAKDQVLFVEKEIHLEKNLNSKTEAGIYLRKEAQLIQGEKNSNQNSGNGDISVFQEGNANAFNFNYWSLPVFKNAGNKKLSDYIFEPLSKTQSQKAKVTNAYEGKADPLEISRRWIYKFSGGEYEDWEFIGNDFELLPGHGFTMKGVTGKNELRVEGVKNNPGNRQRYDFRGTPNDGKIEIPIKTGEILLLGNPYPSAINLRKFLIENTATTGIAYFWDFSENVSSHYLEDYEGGYGAYSPGANTYAPAAFKTYDQNGTETENTGESGKEYAREFSPVGQGFMLMGNNTGTVVFRNSHRDFVQENPQISQFRSRENSIPKIRLNIEFNGLYTRQLILAFSRNATPGADHAMDAKTFGGLTSDAAWLIEDEPYLINVLPFVKEQKIPFSISLEKQSKIKISIESLKDFSAEEIFIYDAEENSFQDLKGSDFRINLPAGSYNDRFFLSFTKETDKPEKTEVILSEEDFPREEIMIFYDKDLLQVEVLANELLDQVEIFDLTGGLIFSKRIYDNKQYFYFYTGNLREAVYIVKVKTRENSFYSQKILLKK